MAHPKRSHCCRLSRRDFLRTGMFGLGVGIAIPLIFRHSAVSIAAQSYFRENAVDSRRILVVVELAGGNDGLNTVVPWRNDTYYRLRPTIAVKPSTVLRLDDELGLHPIMTSLKEIWDEGHLAVVQGCGYLNPSTSHFQSMEYWHTATPGQAQSTGWVGRFADEHLEPVEPSAIVNVSETQSLAVQGRRHAPIVFSDPELFVRAGNPDQEPYFKRLLGGSSSDDNRTLAFVHRIARTAERSSRLVRDAIGEYSTPISYGSESGTASLGTDLRRVAGLIAADFPTQVYYVSMGGFDTHAQQPEFHPNQLMYVADALRGFLRDLDRIGRGADVAVMAFTEFGRRVAENGSGGTDHGTATPMYILGRPVRGGLYGRSPSLDDLDSNGNPKMTMDFRRVYATMMKEWMGFDDTPVVLKGEFPTLGVFV